jgi:hypothetical protein
MIEVLYLVGCPNHEPALDLVREVVEQLGLSAEIREVEVSSEEEAERLRFLGSPSVRVDGSDIEPGADDRNDFALSCRLYGASGLPPRELLTSALSKPERASRRAGRD